MTRSDFALNPYVDLRTGTLHNKVGARSADELKERENTLVNLRMTELKEDPVRGRLDFAHLKEVHRRLFQDVYDWAGQVRQNFDAAKRDYVGGSAYAFVPSAQIHQEAARIFYDLASHDCLKGLTLAEFVPQLARLHGELNHLHAFPEGNGRTQRLFLEQVAENAGHPIDLSIGTEYRIIEASIAQARGQHFMMERLVHEAADADRARAIREAINHLTEVKGHAFVAGIYIAASVPGQQYNGHLYASNGRDFIMRTDDRKLIVGHSMDLPANLHGGDAFQFTSTVETAKLAERAVERVEGERKAKEVEKTQGKEHPKKRFRGKLKDRGHER